MTFRHGTVFPVLLLLLGAASGARAEETLMTITKQDCQSLVVQVPGPGLAYEPGVDVYGRNVTPADLGAAPPLAIPETIEILIEVELQERFGFPANTESYDGTARIGVARVGPDGRAYFNGQPLQDEEQFELAQRCQEILHGRPQAMKP